jgi:hypothetical protein
MPTNEEIKNKLRTRICYLEKQSREQQIRIAELSYAAGQLREIIVAIATHGIEAAPIEVQL